MRNLEMLQVSCDSPDLAPAVNIKHRDKQPHADVADYNACCLLAKTGTPSAALSDRH